MRTAVSWAILVSLALLTVGERTARSQGAPPNEVKRASHFVEKFEKKVARAQGKPFPLGYEEKEAMSRVRALKTAHPTDPAVEKLFQRVKKCVMASKGGFITITPEMLAYRENEQKLAQKVGKIADQEWSDRLKALTDSGELILKPFPAPDPMDCDPDKVIGKRVLIQDFAYPRNEFTDIGGQFCFAGSAMKGFYFFKLSCRSWLGVYEALKRYRRAVSSDIGEKWTVLGRVENVNLLIPQAGEEKTMSAWFGWLVIPEAIYIPGRLLTMVDLESELAGEFAGESRIEELKSEFYTYKSIPDGVEPTELVRILATVVKERNYKLYLECIDPARRATPKAIQRLRYFYDNNLERYRRWYVHVDPFKCSKIRAIKGGEVESGSDEEFFLDEEQKRKIKEHSGQSVEEAIVTIRTYDEKGKQTSYPKKVVLRRYDGKRWYVASGYPL